MLKPEETRMSTVERREIEANLFHAAHDAIDWSTFKWHRDQDCRFYARQANSSQALAIDVFGTLKSASPTERDAILVALCNYLRLPAQGPWNVYLEWEDPDNRLNEKAKSQIDALARGANTTILFECKFTEGDGGQCSQTRKRNSNNSNDNAGASQPERERAPVIQCNGNYEKQSGRSERCVLATKGIRYWDVIPHVFRIDSQQDHVPCPFKGPKFQFMRNLVMAEEIGRTEQRRAVLVIIYVDHPNLPFSQKVTSENWKVFTETLLPGKDILRTLSYQELLGLIVRGVGADRAKWTELERWVLEKIENVVNPRNSVK